MTEQHDLDTEASSRSSSGNGSGESGATDATSENVAQARRERRGPPPNPLYHPLFLPVLLIAFSLWFGYDGFLTTDPEMIEHQLFNRVMFAIMLPVCLWMVPRGFKEFRDEQERAAKKQAERKSS